MTYFKELAAFGEGDLPADEEFLEELNEFILTHFDAEIVRTIGKEQTYDYVLLREANGEFTR